MQAINPTPTGPHPVIAASMRWFAPKPQQQAVQEVRARVYDQLAHGASEEMQEIYRQKAHAIRVAAAKGGAA